MYPADLTKHTFYRNSITTGNLISFPLVTQETDLLIFAERPLLDETRRSVLRYRTQLENHIANFPDFASSLIPLPSYKDVPPLIGEMVEAARLAGVGPMAAVAGAIAERVGNDLLYHTKQVIVENGGDIFLKTSQDVNVGIYAGTSPLSNKLAIKIPSNMTPLGICTSSGTVGHSLSFGKADAVTVMAKSTSLADATATAAGNVVKEASDIAIALDQAKNIEGILGILIIIGDQFGAWGSVELVSI